MCRIFSFRKQLLYGLLIVGTISCLIQSYSVAPQPIRQVDYDITKTGRCGEPRNVMISDKVKDIGYRVNMYGTLNQYGSFGWEETKMVTIKINKTITTNTIMNLFNCIDVRARINETDSEICFVVLCSVFRDKNCEHRCFHINDPDIQIQYTDWSTCDMPKLDIGCKYYSKNLWFDYIEKN
ncbi:MAG: hypothetical protein Dasosvirus3_4 [Dasosvirus sp.]|uniref:Uncharacterized protein n=1 Tax=Dasosvirus sp. TaxID=2487764 RepID=A0A3G4ZRF3_9VIRU|nr:MAG: hypothetical protein Dasosvirus3_4 [Dasosvirus sp.]